MADAATSRLEEEFIRELEDDQSAFFLLSQDADRRPFFTAETLTNRLISTVYSGPTIGDVEAALTMNCRGSTADSGSHICPRATIALPEKGFNKMEGKFTLKVKCCSNGMADDGYKWRKYGQKFIKNSPYPRSYYRCTNPRCNAKKQVERSGEDPETLVVTYEGLHLHYAFSHFLLPQPCDASVTTTTSTVPALKRAKLEGSAAPQASALDTSTGLVAAQPRAAVGEVGVDCRLLVQRGEVFTAQSSLELQEDPVESPQGLLEDVVPGLVRKPCSSSSASTILSDPSLFSVASSPPSSSSSSPFSWPHVSSFFDDLGMLSVPSSPASSSSSAFSWPHDSSFFDMCMLPGTVL